MDKAILADAFFQARLKVNRAYRHFQEANGMFRLYVESDFCKLIEESDAETGSQRFRVETAPVHADLVLAIGDTFHNLSSALDYIMTGMMRAADASATRVSFPTDDSRKALRKSFMPPKPGKGDPRNRRIVETFPGLVMLLLRKIKPYRGGDFSLWEVRKADNIDKHNLIIPAVTVGELRGISLLDEKYNNSFSNITAVVGAGGRVGLVEYSNPGSKLEITNKGNATASIRFSDAMEIFAGEPVFPTLLQCIQAVDQAIGLIESTGTKRFVKP